MSDRRLSCTVTLLVYGFSHSAQFENLAGDVSGFSQRERGILYARAAQLSEIVHVTRWVASSGFRLGKGEVLMFGIPVDEPEEASGRMGLCAVYAVYVSRRRLAAPAMLVQMVAVLDLIVANVCSGSYDGPASSASILTRFLQRYDARSMTDSLKIAAGRYSYIFSSILSPYGRMPRRAITRLRPVTPIGNTFNNRFSDPDYAVCRQAAARIKSSKRASVCYYVSIWGDTKTGLPVQRNNIGHQFLSAGIIITHRLPMEYRPTT
jgi:hypothetical protein